MSHGWLVPVVSAYILFRERKRIIASADRDTRGKWLAAALMVLAVLVGFVGARGAQIRFEIVALAALLWLSTWLFWGWGTAKETAFPCAFLLFMIPLNSFLDVVTVHLRLLATGTAYGILRGLGAEVVRQGTMITSATGKFAIDVAAPCSGLRSIFALMTLTAAYAYFFQSTWLKRAILFAASVPLAMLGNIVRILTIVAVANWCDVEAATGFYHDYSGFVVFLVAVGCMLGVSAMLGNLPWGQTPDRGMTPLEDSGKRQDLLAYVMTVALVAAMVFQATTPNPVLTEAPEISLGEIEGFTGEDLPASEAELSTLPDDTIIVKKAYMRGDVWFAVTCVIGGRSKQSLHRPELCLPSQGFQMVHPRTVTVEGRDWRILDIERGYALPLGFAYTFFNQEGYATASHVKRIFRDSLDRSLRNRVDRWVMVTVNGSVADDGTMGRFLTMLEAAIWKK